MELQDLQVITHVAVRSVRAHMVVVVAEVLMEVLQLNALHPMLQAAHTEAAAVVQTITNIQAVPVVLGQFVLSGQEIPVHSHQPIPATFNQEKT
jgi:hypothetical protein